MYECKIHMYCIYIFMHSACIHSQIFICTNIHMYMRYEDAYMYMYKDISIALVYMYAYVYVYIHMYMYIYTHTYTMWRDAPSR